MCRPADLPTYPVYTYIGLPYIIYKQDDRWVGRSAGRKKVRDVTKYIYRINICKPLCMYIQDERWVGRSAGR